MPSQHKLYISTIRRMRSHVWSGHQRMARHGLVIASDFRQQDNLDIRSLNFDSNCLKHCFCWLYCGEKIPDLQILSTHAGRSKHEVSQNSPTRQSCFYLFIVLTCQQPVRSTQLANSPLDPCCRSSTLHPLAGDVRERANVGCALIPKVLPMKVVICAWQRRCNVTQVVWCEDAERVEFTNFHATLLILH